MWRICVATVRHYPHLFAGMFVALSLGVGLIGVTTRAILAAVSVPAGTVGPALTLQAGNGSEWTLRDTPDDMGGLISVLGLGATVSALVTIMVVAGAAALSVLLRRRDFGRLRMAGAGRGMMRRLVLAEALVVAVPAAFVGSVTLVVTSRPVFAVLNGTSLANVDIAPGPLGLPLAIAIGSGLLMALLGALSGSAAATRTRPHAALQEASLDSGRLTTFRVVLGVVFLGTGSVMVALTFGMNDDTATPVAIFGTIFVAVGLTAFGPAFIAPLLRLCMLPLRLVDPVAGRLAAASVGTARRRTSSLVASVLGVLAVVGIFATVLATSAAGARDDLLARDAAQLEVTAPNGLSRADLDAIRSTPGVSTVAAPVPVDVGVAGPFDAATEQAYAVDLGALSRTNRFDVVEGRIAPLKPGEVAVGKEIASWNGWHVGDRVRYGIFGTNHTATGRVAAVIDAGLSLPPLILPEAAVDARPPAARIVLRDGTSIDDVAQALRASVADSRVTVSTSRAVVGAEQRQQQHLNWVALLILAAPASAYAVIGIASTIIMAVSQRRDEMSAERLLGLGRFQVLRAAVWEALATVVFGVLLAGAVVALGSLAFRASVPVYGGTAALTVPWKLLATVAAGCLATSTAAGLISTARVLSGRTTRT